MQYVYNRLRQRPEPKKLTHEQITRKYLPVIVDRVLRPALHSIWLAGILASAAAFIAYDIFYVGPPFLPPGGPIVVTPTVARLPYTHHQKHVYIAVKQTDDQIGGISILDERAVELKDQFIALGSRFDRAEPNCVAIAPSRRKLFVTDEAAGRVYMIDETWSVQALAVGWNPQCVAISPDERKAYVSNKQPAPYGTISVIDIEKGVVSHTIENANCPDHLAVSRDGRRLYVATECGGDHDPLLVIDTASDKIVATIPDIVIGRAPAVSADGKRIFVARVARSQPSEKKFLLSVFSTVDYRRVDETSFDDSIAAIAFFPGSDGGDLFVAVGSSVRILNPNKVAEQKNEIQTCAQADRTNGQCWPVGLAISERGALYILSRNGKVRFSGLAGLLNPGKP